MQYIFFVRHGQSVANASAVWSPFDSPLTKQGRNQAASAGRNALKRSLQFDYIISSPQPRAYGTAELIAHELQHAAPIQIWPLLQERDWGKLAGEPEHIYYEHGGTLEGLNTIPSVEHIELVQKRAETVLHQLHQLPGKAVHWSAEYATPLEDQSLPQAHIVQLL